MTLPKSIGPILKTFNRNDFVIIIIAIIINHFYILAHPTTWLFV